MLTQAKIQKWGNSSAIRLSAKILAAAGIPSDAEVDIQADSGRVVIQLKEQTGEQFSDKLLAQEPEAEELMALVKARLARTIAMTDETTARCNRLVEKLDQQAAK